MVVELQNVLALLLAAGVVCEEVIYLLFFDLWVQLAVVLVSCHPLLGVERIGAIVAPLVVALALLWV